MSDVDEPINEESPDWMDRIRMLIRDRQAPAQEVPNWVKKLNHEWFTDNIKGLMKATWELGYLDGVRDAFDIVNEEEVNIAMTCLKDWAESK